LAFVTEGLFAGLTLKSQVAGQRVDAGQSRAMTFIWLDMQSVGLGREPATSLWVWTTGGSLIFWLGGGGGEGGGTHQLSKVLSLVCLRLAEFQLKLWEGGLTSVSVVVGNTFISVDSWKDGVGYTFVSIFYAAMLGVFAYCCSCSCHGCGH